MCVLEREKTADGQFSKFFHNFVLRLCYLSSFLIFAMSLKDVNAFLLMWIGQEQSERASLVVQWLRIQNTGDTGSIPGRGRSHMPQSN